MNFVAILAETAGQVTQVTEEAKGSIVPINVIWENVTSLNLLEAMTFISFGIVCLLYGWRLFKLLVIISFALLGMVLGMIAGQRIGGENSQVWGGLIGLIIMAAISVKLTKWAVCLLGAIAGGVLTAGMWYATKLPDEYIWAGGLVGVVGGGMISFVIFKISVMLFTSLAGSGLLVTGALALLHLYPPTADNVWELVFTKHWFLPVILFVPTIVGVYIQNRFIKGSKDWNI
jgi:hypothetical protein